MEVLPAFIRAEHFGQCKIRLVFEPVKDPAYFAQFFIEGGAIAWPNGADVAPETLHERAKAGTVA